MDLIGPAIRLDPAGGKVEFTRAHWVHNAPWPMMHHNPSHTSFWLRLPRTGAEGRASIFDIVARPNHVCDANPTPSVAELEALERAAIVVFLLKIGICPTEVIDPDDDIPF